MPEALLDQMARTSRVRADEALQMRCMQGWQMLALQTPKPPKLTLGSFALIAECKLRAPSSGRLAMSGAGPAQVADRAEVYERAGAAAISVLTEPHRFDGHLDHLRAASQRVSIPVMRKDFLVDPVQVWEARVCGAAGVLLIARMLDTDLLAQMMDAARGAGLFVLLEAFDEADLEKCAAAVAQWHPALPLLVGVNSRDLQTLKVVPERLAQLATSLPQGVPWVAESGMATPEDVGAAAAHGYTVALVGSALMTAEDPHQMASEMKAAGVRCT